MAPQAGTDGPSADAAQSGRRPVPILMLHGQPGSAADWSLVRARLPRQAAVIVPDRPGWDGRTSPGGLQLNARAARAALDAHEAEQAVVVGLSFGGAVAAWLAAEEPARVAGLVLVSPAANLASLQPVDRLLALPVAGDLMSTALLGAAGLALAWPEVRRRLESSFGLPDDYLRETARRLRDPAAWRAFAVEQRGLLRDLPVLEGRLARITTPTTIVIGTSDTIVPLAAGRELARQIPGAELVEIEGGRHVLPAEHPDRLARLVMARACAAAA